MIIKTNRFFLPYLFFLLPLFISGQGENYLWVGGSGDWSDPLHWYSESGGIPGPDDNAIFNANSFTEKYQTVTIDVPAECHDLNWSGIAYDPYLAGSEALTISGSLILSPLLLINYTGGITFSAYQPDHFIRSEGLIINSDLTFEGTGSWFLHDDLNNGLKNIYLNQGTLSANGHSVNCGSFYSVSDNNRTFSLGSGSINMHGFNGIWEVSSSLNLIPGNSTIQFSHENNLSVNIFNGSSLSYGKVIFMNNAIINGSNTFGDLFLNAAHYYRFESDKAQTLTGNLIARGCAGMINISATGSTQAIIEKSNGEVNISFVKLQSIKANLAGSSQFNAFNSVDEGNNEGINIFTDSRDMYWINGTGNWSDTTHWSSTPSGEDSDCVPVAHDNVFFNDVSFNGWDSVKVDLDEISCNDMTWTGSEAPTFINLISSPKLTIYGSLQFSVPMKNEFNGMVVFADTLGGKLIKTSNKNFKKDIFFNGDNGGWTIIDSLKVDGIITHFYGSLNTNSNFVRCQAFISDSAFYRSLDLGSSEIIVTHNINPNSWSLNNENLIFNGGTSSIKMEASGSSFFNYGGDTLRFHNLLFSASIGTPKVFTNSDTYCTFHIADFKSNATIQGSHRFDTISFSPGNYYEFASGATQTIVDDIYPTGTCNGPILLKSITNGSQAKILKTNDTIWVENTAIRDINAIGGAVFKADRSVDLGNNTGWDTITVSAPGKLYWVGGAGNWNDIKHWSLTSGGDGGECIPTPYDTVIFDQNSFGQLDEFTDINLNNAFAHNMDWSAANYLPEFKSANSGAYLRIYGSLKLNSEMEFTFPGYISFESINQGETIVTEGIKFYNLNNNVYFDGIGGEWTLMDSLQLGFSTINKNNIYYYHGDLNTNNKYIDCYGFYSPLQSSRKLSLENSKIIVSYEWNVNGYMLKLVENNSIIQIDSGNFIHKNGSYFPYNFVHFNAVNLPQSMLTENADSVIFERVFFKSKDGKMIGTNGTTYTHFAQFNGKGQINQSVSSNANVYVFDTLLIAGNGSVLGNDTVRNYLFFGSNGNISGHGDYLNAYFSNDGKITGNNVFDTLTFNPPFTYQLGSQNTQTINDQFNITGNNCEFIKLKATSGPQAKVFKESGSVFGEFIEMTKITATGDALFDAGQFSKNIDNSNVGWLFHDGSLNYSLGADTSILEGESIWICAEHFNGNSTTTYEWRNCITGDLLATESCLLVTEKGYYCLTVFYDEGIGCIKQDTIFVGCYLDLLVNPSDVTCYGFNNGTIEIEIEIGVAPFNFNWYSNGSWIGDTQNIYNLPMGSYYFTIEDAEGCISGDTIKISEPQILEMNHLTHDACFGVSNGMISLEVTGGTPPYDYSWSNGYQQPELINVAPGNYSVNVTDFNLCPSITELFVINELQELDFNLYGENLSCYQDASGEIIMTELTGGTGNYMSFEWDNNGNFYTDSLMEIKQLQAGQYSLTITDDYGCIGKDSIIITEPDEIITQLSGTNGSTELGSIDLTVTGGIPPYSFLWNTGAITEDVDPLGGGMYYVEVTDGNYCKVSDSIFIEVHYRIFAPTAFSPNNDLLNDEFELFGLGTDLKSFNLVIFNRYGEVVFETMDENKHWNGRYYNTGEEMPVEVYTWIVELTYYGGVKLINKGNVSLLR